MRRNRCVALVLIQTSLLLAGCAPRQGRPSVVQPTAALQRPAPAPHSPSSLARSFLTSGGWACALDDQRSLFCWLLTSEAPSNIPHVDRRPSMSQVPGLGPIAALDGKEDYVCALDAAGAVFCWGCLIGGTACTLWPTRIALPESAQAIAVGVDGACALAASGGVWCWGLAADSGSGAASPVEHLQDVVELSATALGRCARLRDGTVSCWGDCLGDTCRAPSPVRISGLADAHVITANRSYNCAITGPERQVQCWGLPEPEHTHWESARPRTAAALQAVSTLAGLRDVKQLELGERFGVAVTDDGSLYHWGAEHVGGIYAFEAAPAGRERPKYADNLEPRFAAMLPQDLDLEVVRVSEHLKVKRALVAGYYVCLDLEPGGLRCEPTLEHAPFRIEDVWPGVRFGAQP